MDEVETRAREIAAIVAYAPAEIAGLPVTDRDIEALAQLPPAPVPLWLAGGYTSPEAWIETNWPLYAEHARYAMAIEAKGRDE